MNQTIDIAKEQFSKLQGGTGDAQVDSAADQTSSYSASGEKGQAGQFAQQGQYGAVTGGGFGGGLAKGGDKQAGQADAPGQGQGERKHRPSIYEGMEEGDSTATGGYGRNAKGSSFSRANQMGTDESPAVFGDEDEDDHAYKAGNKTGTSTPGYRQLDEDDSGAAVKNQNTYPSQADDRGSKGNNYNEAEDDEPRI